VVHLHSARRLRRVPNQSPKLFQAAFGVHWRRIALAAAKRRVPTGRQTAGPRFEPWSGSQNSIVRAWTDEVDWHRFQKREVEKCAYAAC